MSTPSIIYARGVVEVSVPASQKIAVQTRGSAKIEKLVGAPNNPGGWAAVGSVSNTQTVFGTFSTAVAVTVRIESTSGDAVLYEVAVAPEVDTIALGDFYARGQAYFAQGAPTALTATATLTIAQLMTLLLTDTHATGATATYTLPTGALTDAGVDMSIGDSFDWTFINLSAAAADTVTIAAAASGHTVVGIMTIPSAHSTTGVVAGGNAAQFRTRKTAADTFITYRIA
jgi:hypothetical protein